MQTYSLILHVVHICCAIFWGGTALTLHFFLLPALNRMGPDGGKATQMIMGTRKFPLVLTVIGTLTILTGLMLMDYLSGHFKADWFTVPMGISLSIGAVAGLIALLTGIFVNKPAADRTVKISAEIAAGGLPPTEGQMAGILANKQTIVTGTRIIAWMILVSMVCMSSARYW